MKYTVSLLLLVAIVHADQNSSKSKEEEENKTARRELLEGNYGLKIRPDVHSTGAPREGSQGNEQQEQIPLQGYGSSEAPQEYGPSKISDVLTGQGPSFPIAIASHLYAPSSVYQPRLGSPTTFKVSEPVQSQLHFSGPFSGLASRPGIPENFLPSLDPLHSQPIYSEQSIHSIYPLLKEFPTDLFQEINNLGNQLTFDEEATQFFENNQENRLTDKKDVEKKFVNQNANQEPSSTPKIPSASKDKLSTTSQNLTTQQAVSYARFSQGLPLSSNAVQVPSQQTLLQPLPSPSPRPQFQQLPHLQQPILFQSLPELQHLQLLQPLPQLHVQLARQSIPQPQLQLIQQSTPQPQLQLIQQSTPQPQLQPLSLQPLLPELTLQPTVQPIASVSPLQTRPTVTVPSQSPARPIRIRQEINKLNQRKQSLIKEPPQFQFKKHTLSSPQPQLTPFSQNQQNLTTQADTLFDSMPTQKYTKLDGLSNEASTVSARLISESSSQSTERSTTPASISIVPKSHSTLPNRPSSGLLLNSSPKLIFTTSTPPTFPTRPVTKVPVSTSALSTLSPVSKPQLSLALLETSNHQLSKFLTEPQNPPALQNAQTIPSLNSSPEQQLVFVTPQPSLQPYSITLQPQVHSQVQVEQQQPLQLVHVQPASVQIQLQPRTPTSFHQQLQIKLHQPDQKQLQYLQSAQQHPLHSEQPPNSQSQLQQQQSEQSQQDREAAIAHAQQLLYDVYSPFIRPLYSETQDILLEQPSYRNNHVSDSVVSTQYYGQHARDIFEHPHYYKKK